MWRPGYSYYHRRDFRYEAIGRPLLDCANMSGAGVIDTEQTNTTIVADARAFAGRGAQGFGTNWLAQSKPGLEQEMLAHIWLPASSPGTFANVLGLQLRARFTTVPGSNRYQLQFATDGSGNFTLIRFWKDVDGAFSEVTTATITAIPFNTGAWMRIRAVGSNIKMKVWPDTATEPTGWNIDATDSTITTPGRMAFGLGNTTPKIVVDYIAWGEDGATAPFPEVGPALFKQGSFNTGTGVVGTTIPIVLGFRPRAIIFWWSGRSEAANANGRASVNMGHGFAVDVSNRHCITGYAQDAAATTVGSGGQHSAACVAINTPGAATFAGLLDIQSINADGFTGIIDQQFSTSIRVHYLAIGGDVVRAAVGKFNSAGAGEQDYTTVGFEPSCVLFMGNSLATDPPVVTVTQVRPMFGVDHRAGKWVTHTTISNANANSSAWTTQTDITGHWPSADWRTSITRFLPNGFRMQWQGNTVSTTTDQFFLALKGVVVATGRMMTRDDGADIVVDGLGFRPKAAIFASLGTNTIGDVNQTTSWSLGAASGPNERAAHGYLDVSALPDTKMATAVLHDAVYVSFDEATAAIDGVMDLKSLDDDGFTCVMDDPDPTPTLVWYLAIGDLPALPAAPLDGLSGVKCALSVSRKLLSTFNGAPYEGGTSGIKQWVDQSGNGNHVSQATAASQPIVRASGPNQRLGAYFDGSDDLLTGGAFTNFMSVSTGYVVCVVLPRGANQTSLLPAGGENLWSGNSTANFGVAIRSPTAAQNAIFPLINDGAAKTGPQNAWAIGDVLAVEWLHESGNLSFRVNGGRTTTVAAGNIAGAETLNVGGRTVSATMLAEMDFYEFVSFNAIPSQAERDALVENMLDYYGGYARDPYMSSLLHFNGAQTTTAANCIDSLFPRTFTFNGQTQFSITSQMGLQSVDMDGTGDYFTIPVSDDYTFGTGDFTIEFWARWRAVGTQMVLFDGRGSPATDGAFPTILMLASSVIAYRTGGANVITGTTVIAINTWYHVALTRIGGVTRLFLDGVQEGSNFSDATNYSLGTGGPRFAAAATGTDPYNGRLDEFSVRKGQGKWAANFTPPTSPYLPPI